MKRQTPWSGYARITCCKDCVAPKRHPGCHDTCKEYFEQKERWEKDKENAKIHSAPTITAYDFTQIGYANDRKYKNK